MDTLDGSEIRYCMIVQFFLYCVCGGWAIRKNEYVTVKYVIKCKTKYFSSVTKEDGRNKI